MAIISGNNGIISYNGTKCSLTEWTVTVSMDTPDLTRIADTYRRYGVGLMSGSGTFTSLEYIAPGFKTSAVASFLTGGGNTVSGTIYITEYKPTVSVGDIVEFQYSFVFTGTITIS